MTDKNQMSIIPVSIKSQQFKNVFLRMDGSGVTAPNPSGGGTVNCQYNAGPWEKFDMIRNDDGTFSFRSLVFPNVFLRMDGDGVTAPNPSGGGTVNCQYNAGPWEKFKVSIVETNEEIGSIVTIESSQFPNVFLRMDGSGVTAPNPSGGGTVNCQYNAGPWEKFHLGAMLNQSIDKLAELYPDQAHALNKYDELIIAHIINGTKPQDQELSELMNIFDDVQDQESVDTQLNASQCAMDAAWLIVDAFVTVIGILGVKIPGKQSIAEKLALKIEIEGTKDIKETVEGLKNATSKKMRAYYVFKILGDVYNGSSFQILLLAFSTAVTSFWDKVKFVVTFVAQLIAWFATEGVALIAQLVLLVSDLIELAEDASAVKSTCYSTV